MRTLVIGTYFAIQTYKHAGDIPTASISERYFPPSGTVDISLFVYKSFAVVLSTSTHWTAEPEKDVLGLQSLCGARTQPMCH